jgi:transcription elongation factor SPT6
VVVVGGFTANTHELRLDVQATLQLHDKEIQDRLDQKLADLRSIDRDVQGLEESDIKDALTDEQYQQMVTENWVHHLPVVFVNDEVARLYQNSERAQAEFAELSPVERYCVGLARHVQDPLCEYAALGNDITALSFDPDQRLVSVRVQ